MADMKKVYDDLIIINLYNIDEPDSSFSSDLTWKMTGNFSNGSLSTKWEKI